MAGHIGAGYAHARPTNDLSIGCFADDFGCTARRRARPGQFQSRPGKCAGEAIRIGMGMQTGISPGWRRCATIKLPENAYLSDDTYGPGWACKREYKADGNSCVAVKLPPNAFLVGSSYSDDWECDRGFRKAGAACVPVIVPKNGYLSDSSQSRGWD